MSALARDPDLGELLGMGAELTADERFFQAGVIFQDMDTDRGGDVDVEEFVAFFGVAPSDEEKSEEMLLPETDAGAVSGAVFVLYRPAFAHAFCSAAAEESAAEESKAAAETLTSRLGNFLGLAPAEENLPAPEPQGGTDNEEGAWPTFSRSLRTCF